jgi:hypothetical protein
MGVTAHITRRRISIINNITTVVGRMGVGVGAACCCDKRMDMASTAHLEAIGTAGACMTTITDLEYIQVDA